MEKEESIADVNTNSPKEIVIANPLCITKEGQSCSTSMIVLVWVSSATQISKEKLIYGYGYVRYPERQHLH